jgi:hypothetical protein
MVAALPVGRFAGRLWLVVAYGVPAVMAWGLLGLLVSVIPLRTAALIVLLAYAGFFGLVEAAGRVRPSPPGSSWQVPSSWVVGVSNRRRVMIWGSMLGPGFATRNPYAAFGLLPLAVAAVGALWYGVLLAAAIGFAHSTGRATALLRGVRQGDEADYLNAVLKQMYWRLFDGFALLLVAGVAIMACRYRF